MGLDNLTINKAKELLQKREVSCEELTQAFFEKIEKADDEIKAYVTLNKDKAIQASKKIDQKSDFSKPLAGIPIAVNDNICTEDLRTSCCSKMLKDFIPPYDATVIKKLKASDSVILGKTNMDEFAFGNSTQTSYFQTTKNPLDCDKIPGGGCGGAAAAVAADEAIFSLASDTGGSLRQPASYCGVVGLRPTYGRVSRFGLAASASSMDTIGPIAKNVTDCAIALNAIAGNDFYDPTSSDISVPNYLEALKKDIKGARIGIPKEYLEDPTEKEVKDAVLKAAQLYEKLGCYCEQTSIVHAEYALWAYYIIFAAEFSSELGQYDGLRYGHRAKEYKNLKDFYMKNRGEGFGYGVKSMVILGTFLSETDVYEKYYLKAQKVKTLIKKDFKEAFKNYDFLITPTVPTTAFKARENNDNSLKKYLNDICTVSVSLAGLPSISVPCGFSEGLPIGLQIIGRPFDEEGILRAAYAFEQETVFHKKQIKRKVV